MTQLANTWKNPTALQERALRQAGRELLLAQASDWPFIIRTGTSPEYARKQVTDRLLRFTNLFHQISGNCINEQFLKNIEDEDNVFPNLDYRYWAEPGAGDISAEEEV
jgi:1,4-alpha-glucan branching enzyme